MKGSNRYARQVEQAVKHFWSTRENQAGAQGLASGIRDPGNRTAVTGGAQMNGFVELVRDQLEESGVGKPVIFCDKAVELPGWFRPEKKWDLLVVVDGKLIACLEFKSHVGSFGNNFNNRTEEALGSASDLLAAYREGAFKPSAKPWLGYLMLLEDSPKSKTPVRAREPHFKVFPEFKSASYAKRYEILLTKLRRERLYDSTCLLLSPRDSGRSDGSYSEPSEELSFERFITSLLGRAIAIAKSN